MAALVFPQSEVADSDAVADALDSGILHWAKGEQPEALRYLRLACEAADAAGDDRRALTLARAAADLAPRSTTTATPLPPVPSDAASDEPRRSKLPEPPAPVKKYVAAANAEGISTGTVSTPASVAPSTSLSQTPTASTLTAKSTSGSYSGRPTAPSMRPSAAPGSATPLPPRASSPPNVASTSSLGAAASGVPTAGSRVASTNAARGATAISAPPGSSATARHVPREKQARPKHLDGAGTIGPSQTPIAIPTAQKHDRDAHRSAAPDNRSHAVPDAHDYRLASVRVRIEGVGSDGTLQVKLLDLTATASGEDNALLVVSQGLWQELKRAGRF